MAKNENANQATAETESTATPNPAATPLFILLNKDQLKTLRTALGGDRVLFVTDEESSAYSKLEKRIETAAVATTDEESGEPFFGVRLIPRTGDEGALLQDAESIMLSTVGVRDKKTSTNGIKAIVAYEVPSPSAFLADESDAAQSFVMKVIERECADVAFAGLRAPDMTIADMERAVAAMPTTVGDIVTTSRETSGVDSDAFDTLWTPFKNGIIKEKSPAIYAALPSKAEVQKALRSKAYALANPATRAGEEMGLWVKLLNGLIRVAPEFQDDKGNATPVDPASLNDWLEGRDELELSYSVKTLESADLTQIEF